MLSENSLNPSIKTAIAKASNFKGVYNNDWIPFSAKLADIDSEIPLPDLEMCLVPVGKFMMGSNDGFSDEKPVHEQFIDAPYWISRYPITNSQWKQAVVAGVVAEPFDKIWYGDKNLQDCPVVTVEWLQCLNFAEWLSCSLPTEPLWEYAARGVENWIYPWGNHWDEGKHLVSSKNGYKQPASITIGSEGESWVGARQLSGNVWEWLLNSYEVYPYRSHDGREDDLENIETFRSLRGGAWEYYFNLDYRASSRHYYAGLYFDDYIGFRIYKTITSNTGL